MSTFFLMAKIALVAFYAVTTLVWLLLLIAAHAMLLWVGV
jgi:hypothetical protein